jgi:hypothetical protein
MDMRIVVPSAESATMLAERLRAGFGSARISVRGENREVDIHVDQESDRTVLRVLDVVERWLDQTSVAFAEMWLGEQSYTLARWVPLEGPR